MARDIDMGNTTVWIVCLLIRCSHRVEPKQQHIPVLVSYSPNTFLKLMLIPSASKASPEAGNLQVPIGR